MRQIRKEQQAHDHSEVVLGAQAAQVWSKRTSLLQDYGLWAHSVHFASGPLVTHIVAQAGFGTLHHDKSDTWMEKVSGRAGDPNMFGFAVIRLP